MKRLILFGAPGSGKGTMGDFIQRDFHMLKISTGDILRSAIQQDTAEGRLAKKYLEAGSLVPDDVVIELVRRRLSLDDLDKGYVLDGYPRTRLQAEALSEIASAGEKAIFIDVSEAEAVQRLMARLTCSSCGAIYNQVTKPPKKADICDLCNGRVERRSDDNEEAVRNRFRVYAESTMPVIDYYERRGSLVRIDGAGTAGDVYAKLKGLIS